MYDRIRVAIIGAGKRSDYLYAPLLNVLKEDVEFVGFWGRSEDKARELGEKYHVPGLLILGICGMTWTYQDYRTRSNFVMRLVDFNRNRRGWRGS